MGQTFIKDIKTKPHDPEGVAQNKKKTKSPTKMQGLNIFIYNLALRKLS